MLNFLDRQLVRRRPRLACLQLESLEDRRMLSGAFWQGFARDAQHTATSTVGSLPISVIRWSAPVDLSPQYSGNDLLAHYGSPLVTTAGTVLLPIKTGASGGFEVQARQLLSGTLNWTATSDYVLPAHNWLPSFGPTLAPSGRLYMPASGGTILEIENPDASSTPATIRLAFYGISSYTGSPEDSTIFIDTPITADAAGNLYFGFIATASNPLGLRSGIARIDSSGNGDYVAASTAAGDSTITEVEMNSAPALSADGKTLYIAVSTGSMGRGDLVALDSTTLATKAVVALKDPATGNDASLSDDGTASPTVGPDGDVYFGVLDNPLGSHHARGWLLHFSGDLRTTKTPGAFGWDDTASVVPASMVPSYHGSASYLLMVKYNDYAQAGGTGINQIALLDPTETMADSVTGVIMMCPALAIAGPTPDPAFTATHPGAVREWCINTAAVDPLTKSILANSEDGILYRWDLTTNTFSQRIVLTPGLGEAYTPTVIASDGTVLAINNATLFAVGKLPTHNPPIAVNDSYMAVLNTPLIVPASLGVLQNDTDIDGNPITTILVSQPAHGSVSLNADGSFTYTPATGYVGADSFTYRDTDGTLDSNIATVSLSVIQNYNPPVAGNDTFSTTQGETLVVPAPGILANDFAPDGGTLTPQLVRGPAHGTLGFTGGGGFYYDPASSFSGVDTFQYRVTDGISLSNVATVEIAVLGSSSPPIVTPQSVQAEQGSPLVGALVGTILFSNPSQSTGSYSALVNWGDGTPVSVATVVPVDSQVSQITASHVYDAPGMFTFTLTVKEGYDGAGGSMSAQGTALVAPFSTPLTGSLVLRSIVSRTATGIPVVNQSFQTIAGTAPEGWQVQAFAAAGVVLATATADSTGHFVLNTLLSDGLLNLTITAFNPAAQQAGSHLVLSSLAGTVLVDTTPPVVQAVRLVTRSGQIRITYFDSGAGIDPATILNLAGYTVLQAQKRGWKLVSTLSLLDLGTMGKPGSHTVALVLNGGRRLTASRYMLRIAGSSISDLAHNLLDGKFLRKLPSGDRRPGTDFLAQIDTRGRVLPVAAIPAKR
jgi:hypothetical protein